MKKLTIRLICECLLAIAFASISASLFLTYDSICGSLSTTQILMVACVTIYALLSAIVSILETYRKILEEELEELRKGRSE